MRIVADTSVWSNLLRRSADSLDPQAEKLVAVIEQGQPIVLIGVILQELLQGIRRASDFQKVRDHLEAFQLLHLDRDDFVEAAELRNRCASNGLNISTIDAQIAAACVRHDCALLTSDHDFDAVSRFCSLRLL